MTRPPDLLGVLAALALLSGCPATGVDDDDDTSADDDDGSDFVCGLPSNGSGGPDGLTWLEVDGYSTPADAVPDYEIAVYQPPGIDASVALPLLLITARRMPLDRPTNEMILFGDQPNLSLDTYADEQQWLGAMLLPGPTGDGLNWTSSPEDLTYWHAAVDLLEANYNVDRDRIWQAGSSAGGNATVYLGHVTADRTAAIADHAGSNPYQGNWPATPWDDDCAGVFIHDINDTIVPRASVEDAAAMWEDAGQHTEREYEYSAGHAWDYDQIGAIFADFFPRTCNRTE